MPHQCVRCGTLFDDGSKELLKGCNCGARLFFYIKKEKLKEIQAKTVKLTTEEKEQIEKDVFDLVGSEIDKDQPIVLDLESVRVVKPGKYELDLVNLFKKEPLVIRLGEGKYAIDLIQSFKDILDGKAEEE